MGELGRCLDRKRIWARGLCNGNFRRQHHEFLSKPLVAHCRLLTSSVLAAPLFFHRVGRDIMTSLHFGELLARKLPLDADSRAELLQFEACMSMRNVSFLSHQQSLENLRQRCQIGP